MKKHILKPMTIKEANKFRRINRAKFGKISTKVPTGTICISQNKLKKLLIDYFEFSYHDALRVSNGVRLEEEKYNFSFVSKMGYRDFLEAMALNNYIKLIDELSWKIAFDNKYKKLEK